MVKFYVSSVTINIRIFVILILLTMIPKETNTECKYKPCGSQPHTMCIYPAQLDKTKNTCKGPESKGGLTKEQRRGLLDSHNEKRQMIAQGKVSGQPKAANMMKLRWNSELEEIAQRFLNSCPETVAHDSCRDLLNGTSVGQNSAYGPFQYKQFPDNKDLGESVVKMWFSEVKDMNPSYVDDITTSGNQFSKIAHYTQLAWATSQELGCGYLTHDYRNDGSGDVYQYYTCNCNYAPSGNMFMPHSEVYKTGEPCSQCPENTRCSKRFPGLCTAEKDESAGSFLRPHVSSLVFAMLCATSKYFYQN